MQWIDGVLSKGEPIEFFHDEFRCPVYVKDVVEIILSLTNKWISGITEYFTFQYKIAPEFLVFRHSCVFVK